MAVLRDAMFAKFLQWMVSFRPGLIGVFAVQAVVEVNKEERDRAVILHQAIAEKHALVSTRKLLSATLNLAQVRMRVFWINTYSAM